MYSTEVKEAAKSLFLLRCKAKEIQAQLNLPNIRIVYYWIRQDGWENLLPDEESLGEAEALQLHQVRHGRVHYSKTKSSKNWSVPIQKKP